MTATVVPFERRLRARRASPGPAPVMVMDVITGATLGHLCNLSETGVLLVGRSAPRADALFQARLRLPGGPEGEAQVELGLQAQWQQSAAMPGQIWAGYRIVSVTPDGARAMRAWLQTHPQEPPAP